MANPVAHLEERPISAHDWYLSSLLPSHLMPQFQAKAEALKANIILQVSKGNLEGKNFKKQVKVVSKACRAPLLP